MSTLFEYTYVYCNNNNNGERQLNIKHVLEKEIVGLPVSDRSCTQILQYRDNETFKKREGWGKTQMFNTYFLDNGEKPV